jgi:hypothetical protein
MALSLSALNLLTPSEISKFIFGVDDVTVGSILTSQQIFSLEMAADAASALIQKYCDFTFISGNYVEIWDGAASDEVIPREIPITAISEVRFSENGIFTSSSTIVSSDLYSIGSRGLSINLKNGILTPRGRGSVKVSYTAGYTTIPKDLKFAALKQLQYMYKQIGKGDGMTGLKMISKMNEAQTKDDSIGSSGLISEAEGMVRGYQRFECSSSVMFTRVT